MYTLLVSKNIYDYYQGEEDGISFPIHDVDEGLYLSQTFTQKGFEVAIIMSPKEG